MAPKVLISDNLSQSAVDIFENRGIEVDFLPELGKDKEELLAKIGGYDGLAIRSATKVSAKVLDSAKNLKVVGRAGIGVDNVDIPAASQKGVIVMNTPFGNSITTAEHAIAMMFAVARQIPAANESTHAGKWEKSAFMGVELTGKRLGIIGCGNIGSIVASRAQGLAMRVLAYDPFLTIERARDIGVKKVELDELLSRSDFISLHTPLTDKTRNILSADALNATKKGVRIINCARGGLVDEAALRSAIENGHVAGAAFDVFSKEPATENILFGVKNVVVTPHLGAATSEAQEKVAIQVAEQMSDYLLNGAVTNAVNMPSITAEEAPQLEPFCTLADQLGSFAGQLTQTAISGVCLEYEGKVSEMNTKALTAAALTGLLRPQLYDVNMVSAPILVKQRGIAVEEIHREQHGAYENYIRLTVTTERGERSVAGTVFADGRPRLIQVKGINMEAELGSHMLYITNHDKPGFIGALGKTLGDSDVNIATFHLGRRVQGEEAIALVEIDGEIDQSILGKIIELPHVQQVQALKF